MSDKKGHIASFVFVIRVNEETCLVQADSAHITDEGFLRFVVHNDSKSIVAAFKEYSYFIIEGVNE